nr:MAG TPA: hypothetical protein [Bacteriophage sp.]
MANLFIDWRFSHCDGWSLDRFILWRCVKSVLLGSVI